MKLSNNFISFLAQVLISSARVRDPGVEDLYANDIFV